MSKREDILIDAVIVDLLTEGRIDARGITERVCEAFVDAHRGDEPKEKAVQARVDKLVKDGLLTMREEVTVHHWYELVKDGDG